MRKDDSPRFRFQPPSVAGFVYNYAVPSSPCMRPLHMSNALRLSRSRTRTREGFSRGRREAESFGARLSCNDDSNDDSNDGDGDDTTFSRSRASYHHIPVRSTLLNLRMPVGTLLSRHRHLGDHRGVCTGATGLGNYHSQVSGRPAAARPCVTIGCTMTAVMRHRRYVTSPVPRGAGACAT